jgi:hypothetical protein
MIQTKFHAAIAAAWNSQFFGEKWDLQNDFPIGNLGLDAVIKAAYGLGDGNYAAAPFGFAAVDGNTVFIDGDNGTQRFGKGPRIPALQQIIVSEGSGGNRIAPSDQ